MLSSLKIISKRKKIIWDILKGRVTTYNKRLSGNSGVTE
jgi:hypothetical protein